MKLLLQLSRIWLLIILGADLFRFQVYLDHKYPNPSQAEVDKVYYDNNDYRAEQIDLVINTINTFAQGVETTSQNYTNQPPNK